MSIRDWLLPRGVPLLMGGASLVCVWRTWQLERWSFMGAPGPGLFPLFVFGLCALVALALCIAPGTRPAEPAPLDDDEVPFGQLAPPEKRTFLCYAAALVLLIPGSRFLGFIGTVFALTLIVTWMGERRSLRSALLFATVVAILGVVVFQFLLKVELPTAWPDRNLRALLQLTKDLLWKH